MVKSKGRDVFLVERDEKGKKVGVATRKQPLVQVRKAEEIKKPSVSGAIHRLLDRDVFHFSNLRRQSCSRSFCPW